MAPACMTDAKKTYSAIKKTASRLRNVQTLICPPFIYLNELKKNTSGHRCVVGAQDSFWESKGNAHTGEISPEMLSNLGLSYVILGHSEKRAQGDSNEIVNRKVVECFKKGFTVVLCVGEIKRDEHAEYAKFIEEEITQSLKNVQRKFLSNLIIAYEPIWAIGNSAIKSASPEDAFEVSILIKKILTGIFSKKIAMSVPVLYGGSVDVGNSKSFLVDGGVDGLLIGRASLSSDKFSKILEIANKA